MPGTSRSPNAQPRTADGPRSLAAPRPSTAPREEPRRGTHLLDVLRPHRDGVLVALSGFAGGLILWKLGLYNTPAVGRRYGAWLLVPLAVMCLTALGRRSAQPWALAVAVAALAGDFMMGSLLATVIVFTDIVYAAVLYGPPRTARAVLPGSVAVTVAVTLGLVAAFRKPETLLLGVLCAGITIMPAWTGLVVRDHRNAAAAERLRAEQTALLAEMDRVQAVTAERARMARELHDVVANHLSAIAIHSTAALSMSGAGEQQDGGDEGGPAGTSDGFREAAGEALGVIRRNSVQGLAEMRRLIGLLRDPHDDGAPPTSPTLAGLDALVDRARTGAAGTGLRFTLRDGREPASEEPPLPAPVELAAYRVVQESLTNALKHAGDGTVVVELHREPREAAASAPALTVRVTSPLDGGRRGTAPRAPGSGAGLIGMRERVELLGGELCAGPAADTGGAAVWEVTAELPVDERSLQ
ncbi:Signal transduction histidine kinase [Streptomyces sp. WMMB 714]|uniref:sensor histidine kinase n=1 Tax=Streptomyces sp. WMMB 714 TaxID=1286822 RepID=UPI000823836B|nr:histidine kinase [Streptomyces sp. WMMB 714]SCK11147.1 Signal transduction histidine kinase [Streptomyces sp. WMMB 714]